MAADSTLHLAHCLASVGVSEILKITERANALRRQGADLLVLGAGEPDFDTPEHIKEAAIQAIRAGQTKYTVLDGSPALKEAIRRKFARENDLVFAQDEVTASAGAKQVIFNAMMATLDAGDEVIIPAPFWVTYADIVTILGGTPVVLPCREEDGFRLTAAALEAAITPRTHWVMLNSPSNPSGAAYGEEHYRPLLEVLLRHPQVWLMVDDMYEHILYDGFRFVNPAWEGLTRPRPPPSNSTTPWIRPSIPRTAPACASWWRISRRASACIGMAWCGCGCRWRVIAGCRWSCAPASMARSRAP